MMNKHTLMIVDDDDQLRTILGGELREMGFDVTTAGDGGEAIEIIQHKTFDLVVLDIRMPGVDGFHVLRFTKEKYPQTRVIMVTAFNDLQHAIEAKRLGADAFIGKPYDITDLGTSIHRVLSI